MHQFFSKTETLLRLRRGPLGNYLDRYADWLSEPGFCRVHARLQLVQIADFSPIALWLGHESPATTHVYLDATWHSKNKFWTRSELWVEQKQDVTVRRTPS